MLLRQGDTEYLAAYGTREFGGEAVTLDDHFRIGSNTKTMTGTVILQLIDEGELALDDPVSDHAPEVLLGMIIEEITGNSVGRSSAPGFSSRSVSRRRGP